MNRSVLILCAAFTAALVVPADRSAFAQSANPAQLTTPGAKVGAGAGGGGRPAQSKREEAPPALPGSRAEPTAVAPASRVPTDMPPTEALFAAVNRGDLATAKDAIGRGADLNGTNVLGLTPLELAVDLGRNEISFLLLSLRGGAGYSTTSGPAGSAKDAAPKPMTRAERQAAQRAERAERTARARPAAAEPAPAVPQTARLFTGNGGTPAPQAGFLGFDSGR